MMPERVGKIAIQRELRILHQAVDAEMKPLGRLAPAGNLLERGFELRQILHLDHQVELAAPLRREAELAPRQPPALDQPLLLQMSQIAGDALGKRDVADTRLQIAPDMI